MYLNTSLNKNNLKIDAILINGFSRFLAATMKKLYLPIFSSGFSFIETSNSQDSREREGLNLLPLYYFQQPTNSQNFFCKFSTEMTASCL